MEFYSTVFIIVSLCLLCLHLLLKYNRKKRLTNGTHGPPALPFFGNIFDVHIPHEKIFQLFIDMGKKYYPVYRLWSFNMIIFVIRHPDDLEILMTCPKNINKEFAYEPLRPWLRNGLLVSYAKLWHNRRKILTPAFHFNILKRYMDITNQQGSKIIENLRAKGKEIDLEVVQFSSDCTLDIICESAMGVSLSGNLDKESANKYKEAIHKMGYVAIQRMTKPYIRDWILPFVRSLYNIQTAALKVLDDFTNKIVEERREYHIQTNFEHLKNLTGDVATEQENIYVGKKKKSLAMLDLLLAAERDGLIDDAGIKEEVSTFVFEGHDTTGMALTFIILLLAENKNAQEKAREEVVEILNRRGGNLETADLSQMNYLERCIKESIRLYPSVHTVGRYITEDIQLKHCFLTQGCHVLLRVIDVHRDPNFWPEPEKFDPDRFLPDEVKKRHPFSYLPFSAGPRNCIGQKFAMMEMKSLVSRILYNFHLEPIDYTRDVDILADIVIRPSRPLYTKFIRINRN